MAIASHLPDSRNADAWFARIDGYSRVLALLAALLALFAPATVWGDIYKWIDERGNTVLSNVKPVDPDAVRNFQLAAKETKTAAQAPAPAQQARPAEVVKPTEQLLLEKIESLERQVQAQQYAAQAVTPVINYYTAPAPPPPPNYYGYDGPGFYPGYYYPPPPSYSYIVPAIPVVFPRKAIVFPSKGIGHRPFVHRPFVHRPAFVNRAAIVNSGPVFVTPHRSSLTGGSMRRGSR